MRTVERAVALAALLPCMVAAAAPVVAVRPAAAVSSPKAAAQASARTQVTLALTNVTPKIVRDRSAIDIVGSAQNRSGRQLTGLTLRLRYSSRATTSRGQLEQYASGSAAPPPNVLQKQLQLPQAATPSATQNWKFHTTSAALGLTRFGVYPVSVEALNSAQQVVGSVTTFLTFMSKQPGFKPVKVGWIWPLIDRQHRANDQTFLDDQLSTDMAPGGRLDGLVRATQSGQAAKVPITWGIDPALLDDVQTMASNGYSVKQPGAKKGTGKKKSAAAGAWLSLLKSGLKDSPYFVVPYADPDAVALVRNKMPRDLAIAYDPKNTGVATQALGRPPKARIAWPPSGAAGGQTLDQLAKLGLKTGGSFLMNSSQFQDTAQGVPPQAITTLPTHYGTKKTLLYDNTLNDIVSGDTRSPGKQVLAEQRFLAETAMIADETPSIQRTLVITPDRHWNPSPSFAKNLLTYTGGADWLRKTSVSEIEKDKPQARVFKGYSEAYEAYELGTNYLDQVRRISGRASSFSGVMTGQLNITYQRAVLRSESAAWRGRPQRARQARVELSNELAADMAKVRIITSPNKRIVMAGNSGRFPVTVENTLHNQTIKVKLTATPTADSTTKLRLGRLNARDEVIELRPGEQVQRWIPAKASGNGNFHVHLQLEIPDGKGRQFGTGETITVRATGYGQLALVITGGGLAVLFVGVGVRAIRARRRRKAEAAGDGSTGMGPTGMGPGGTGTPGNGFPGPGIPGSGIPAAEFPGTEPGPRSGTGPNARPNTGSGTGPQPGSATGTGPATSAGPAPGVSASGPGPSQPGGLSGSAPAGLPGSAGLPPTGSPAAAGAAGPESVWPAGPGASEPGTTAAGATGSDSSGSGLPGPWSAGPGRNAAGPATPGSGVPTPGIPGAEPNAGIPADAAEPESSVNGVSEPTADSQATGPGKHRGRDGG